MIISINFWYILEKYPNMKGNMLILYENSINEVLTNKFYLKDFDKISFDEINIDKDIKIFAKKNQEAGNYKKIIEEFNTDKIDYILCNSKNFIELSRIIHALLITGKLDKQEEVKIIYKLGEEYILYLSSPDAMLKLNLYL